jgi:toxin HigB-1
MDILFKNEQLRKLCNEGREAPRKLNENATRLRRRLDDMAAASCLEDMRNLPGQIEELKADRHGQLSLRISGGLRLVFRPAHGPCPAKPDGGLDWKAVTAVLILEVVDYHD